MITGKGVITRDQKITAYEIAVANGFVGTEQEWLDSLVPTPAYKVYKASVTVTSPNAPVVTVFENTLDDEVVWTRPNPGAYDAESASFSDPSKVFITVTPTVNSPQFTNVMFNGWDIPNTASFRNYILKFDVDLVYYETNDTTPKTYFNVIIEVYP